MTVAADAARVLIVEDEAISGLYLESVVVAMGHRVVAVVGAGHKAVEIAAVAEVDLVLMDIRLSDDLDGITAAEMIDARVPVIFHSAYTDLLTVDRAKRLKPVAVLEKPATEGRLRNAIEAGLARRRS